MNDELSSGGLNAFEGYTLGRLSAQNQQVLGDAAEAFGRRRFQAAAPVVDVNALLAENESLRRQLGTTQAELATLRSSYSELDAWANTASALLREKGLIND